LKRPRREAAEHENRQKKDEVYIMAHNSLTSGKFAEDLYFLLMASPLRARVQTLGARYGLSPAALRSAIIALANTVGRNAILNMREAACPPTRNAG
jgi:hypothetical protein